MASAAKQSRARAASTDLAADNWIASPAARNDGEGICGFLSEIAAMCHYFGPLVLEPRWVKGAKVRAGSGIFVLVLETVSPAKAGVHCAAHELHPAQTLAFPPPVISCCIWHGSRPSPG
jgi:hypothetical protein